MRIRFIWKKSIKCFLFLGVALFVVCVTLKRISAEIDNQLEKDEVRILCLLDKYRIRSDFNWIFIEEDDTRGPAPSLLYNLMEEKYGKHWKKANNHSISIENCNLSNVNFKKTQILNKLCVMNSTVSCRLRQYQSIGARPSLCHSSHSNELHSPTGTEKCFLQLYQFPESSRSKWWTGWSCPSTLTE